jgi:glyoxylase-like metal-dependent hydrolase (beta-lactamase superfamily II)
VDRTNHQPVKILLDRFQNARAIAVSPVVKAMQKQIDPNLIKNYWNKLFPDQIPEPLIVPEALESNEFELEGHKLVVLDNGFTDTEYSTSLYVPSIDLVVAGDVVYNGVHPFMPETTEQSRLNWIAALDRIEELEPHAVVAGHKNHTNEDNPKHIGATRGSKLSASLADDVLLLIQTSLTVADNDRTLDKEATSYNEI